MTYIEGVVLSDELVVSRVLSNRTGVFGKHQLIGLLHVGESGERFWHVQQIGPDIVRHYCVQNNRVFWLTVDLLVVEPFSTRLERGSEVLDMRGDVRDAIHDAIASWEAEDQTVAYGRVEL
jgi:hypothetical protein